MSFNNIPTALKSLDKWILWRKEVVNGNETKVPYQNNSTRASVDNPATWASFDHVTANIGWNNGIGFVLTKDDPFVIIDYDEECPQEVIESFNTYTERSQSGRGVHIIMEGDFEGRKRKGKVECYKDMRYIIMTGDVVLDKPVRNCQSELDAWRTTHGLDEQPQEYSITTTVSRSEIGNNTEILERMFNSQNGDEIRNLYNNGYTAGDDRSQVDAKMLEALRFWSGGSKEIAFELFAGSACCRDKWVNRADYRERTWGHVNRGDVWQPQEFVDERMVVGLDFCDRKIEEMKQDQSLPWQDSGVPMLEADQYNPTNMGALSEICRLFNETSPKPVESFAMHTALATLGAYLARRFKTVSGNYTSLYWGVVAPTGGGKAHTTRIIDHVLTSLDPALGMLIKGSGYTSDSAIFNTLQQTPAHIGIIDELGDYIAGSRNKSNHTAQAQWRTLKEVWCNGGTVRPKNYSDHSIRTESNAQRFCVCPNISLFGNSTVAQFWSSLSIKDGADGFLNRWLVYTDEKRVLARLRIVDLHNVPVPGKLVKWHDTICDRSPIRMMVTGGDESDAIPMVSGSPGERPDPVTLDWEEGAEELFYRYQVEVIEGYYEDTFKYEMLQRAAQMARSISLIVELSKNPWAEYITQSSCIWAIGYVNTIIGQMAKYAKRHIAGNEEESLALKLLDNIRRAGDNGLTKKEMQALKLEEFTARNFKDAITRLAEAELIDTKVRKSSGRGRNSTAYYAIETEEKEND